MACERRPKEELYDLKKDPHQLRSVAGDAAYKRELQDHRERLTILLKASGDPRLDSAATADSTSSR